MKIKKIGWSYKTTYLVYKMKKFKIETQIFEICVSYELVKGECNYEYISTKLFE